MKHPTTPLQNTTTTRAILYQLAMSLSWRAPRAKLAPMTAPATVHMTQTTREITRSRATIDRAAGSNSASSGGNFQGGKVGPMSSMLTMMGGAGVRGHPKALRNFAKPSRGLHEVHGIDVEHLRDVVRPGEAGAQFRQVRHDLRHRVREIPKLPPILVLDLLDRRRRGSAQFDAAAQRQFHQFRPLLRKKFQLLRVRPAKQVVNQVAVGRVIKAPPQRQFGRRKPGIVRVAGKLHRRGLRGERLHDYLSGPG